MYIVSHVVATTQVEWSESSSLNSLIIMYNVYIEHLPPPPIGM